MVRNKYIIFPFLLLAWAIIFLHSVIPHHHHSDDLFSECNYCQVHYHHVSQVGEILSSAHHCNEHVCHFHVDLLNQISIDNVFIVDTENVFFDYLTFIETCNDNYFDEFVSDHLVKSNYLRGPPPKELKS